MIYLIAGASHTGKTRLAQELLDVYHFPYLSIDHLKMGLIRSGYTTLTTEDDEQLTEYLWPIVREMVKTAIENNQNLIVEGCYIPFDWKKDFTEEYLAHIAHCWLVFSEKYIRAHYDDILNYGNVIEQRMENEYPLEQMVVENNYNLQMCKKYQLQYYLFDDEYVIEDVIELFDEN